MHKVPLAIILTMIAMAGSAVIAKAETTVEESKVQAYEKPITYNHWQNRRPILRNQGTGEAVADTIFSPFAAIVGTVDAIKLAPQLN
ncbi:MAG: hypothetical protein AAGE80_14865 [Pseudomonadota bacterium]